MSQDELKPGMRLGSFELLAPIGKGGMASVWVASGEALGAGSSRLFALKVMLPELVGDPAFHEMFLAEGRLIRSIQHPHVVRVFDVGVAGQHLYIAMEWVEGASLHTLIAEANRRRPIPNELAVRLIADTAAGLHAAHEVRDENGEPRGVVHCDVSPHNILVGIKRGVKLVDFGVASTLNHLGASPGHVRGKFSYMSPEQTRGENLDRRSDIFSLGIVLFELTTGFRLFRGESPQQAIDLVRNGPIVDPRELRADYPPVLAEIVLKALQRDPQDRFQTAELFQRALESYLLAEQIVVPRAGINGLLQRVLGERITKQRASIENAAKSLGAEQLLPSDTSQSIPAPDDDSVGAVSGPPTPAPSRKASRVMWSAFAATAAAVAAVGLGLALRATPPAGSSTAAAGIPSAKTSALEPAPSQDPTGSPAPRDSALLAPMPNELAPTPPSAPALSLTALPKVDIAEPADEEEGAPPSSQAPSRSSKTSSDSQRLARARANAAGCALDIGPHGAGRVRLSVTSSGAVVAAAVSAPFAGTAVGNCVTAKYQALKLSPGAPRTITRTFDVR